MSKRSLFILYITLLLGVYGCLSPTRESSVKNGGALETLAKEEMIKGDHHPLAGNFSDQQSLHFDSTLVESFFREYPYFKALQKELWRFYSQRQYAYAWYEEGRLIEQADALYARISHIEEEGVPNSFLYQEAFHSMMKGENTSLSIAQPNPRSELMLTAQYLWYARTVWLGTSQGLETDKEWFLPRKRMTLTKLMEWFLEEQIRPSNDTPAVYMQYDLLKKYLKKYRDIEKAGGFPRIAAPKVPLQIGDSSLAIQHIRKYLHSTEDYKGDTSRNTFDEPMYIAVKEFQRRHGLTPDGIIGKKTLQEMNVSVRQRIQQIIVNMERCRWIPLDMKDDYLMVNIPAYALYVYEKDSIIREMRVVVGKTVNKTAIFTGQLSAIVFNPYWYIPPGIYQKEILPEIKKDTGYLSKNHMEWVNNQLRQKPGPDNPLGKIKFIFPNSHHIFLHDTPSKDLFEKEKRAFSHGCIRMEDPVWLVNYLMQTDSSWSDAKLKKFLAGSIEQSIALKKKMPVYVVYLTAWVDEKARIQFRDDIYQKDKMIADRLIEQSGKGNK